MNISEYIKDYREKWNMSKAALADDLGVSISAVNSWENNKALPNEIMREILSEYFGIDFSRVFKLYDDKGNHLTTGTDQELADYLGIAKGQVRRKTYLRPESRYAGYRKEEVEWCSGFSEVI